MGCFLIFHSASLGNQLILPVSKIMSHRYIMDQLVTSVGIKCVLKGKNGWHEYSNEDVRFLFIVLHMNCPL